MARLWSVKREEYPRGRRPYIQKGLSVPAAKPGRSRPYARFLERERARSGHPNYHRAHGSERGRWRARLRELQLKGRRVRAS